MLADMGTGTLDRPEETVIDGTLCARGAGIDGLEVVVADADAAALDKVPRFEVVAELEYISPFGGFARGLSAIGVGTELLVMIRVTNDGVQ